ncbi:mitochondrial transcription rescue factor 1 [Megalops cyprinoides]|uniref:mitochondrial transcription rescue factor 1 n=1 Tax=Megalops cyprinoides TaxID=118141 RepID=UPI001864CEBF|nr:mitochondrial transcription rescue factor 1 [Megalops cyprinoides]
MRGLRVHALRRILALTSSLKDTSSHGVCSTGPSGSVPRVLPVCHFRSSPSPMTPWMRLVPHVWGLSQNWSSVLVRFKSGKGSKKRGKKPIQEEDEDDDEDDPEASDYEDELPDDPGLPKDYKDLEKSVQSFRYDLIMKAGLDMARNKVEDAFYSNKLRLNGQKLIKKSKTVKVGDTLDLVLEENSETDTVTLMRIIFKKVTGETKDAEKYKVILRRWKNLKLPKQEAYKQ